MASPKPSSSNSVNAKLLSLAALALAAVPAARAADNLSSEFRKNGDAVTVNFDDQRAILQQSSAVMRNGRKDIAYGTVVSADGYILTKASEVQSVSALSVLVDTTKYDARIVATDPVWDVALVKIEAQGLQPVNYATNGDVPQGTWVVANGATSLVKRRALAGIISAKPREIPAAGGAALGVVLKNGGKALEIEQVNDKSGAQEAGLAKGDILVAVEGKKVAKLEDMAAILKEKKAGTIVKITYRRSDKEKTVDVRLMARGEMGGEKTATTR